MCTLAVGQLCLDYNSALFPPLGKKSLGKPEGIHRLRMSAKGGGPLESKGADEATHSGGWQKTAEQVCRNGGLACSARLPQAGGGGGVRGSWCGGSTGYRAQRARRRRQTSGLQRALARPVCADQARRLIAAERPPPLAARARRPTGRPSATC